MTKHRLASLKGQTINKHVYGNGRGHLSGLFLIGLMACLAILVSTAQAQNYSVKEIAILPDAKAFEPAAINNQGQVAGTASAGEFGYASRYYFNGKENEIERKGDLGSRAFGINPSGIIVGDAFFKSPSGPVSHAAIFNGRGTVDLGALENQTFSRANAMNAIRQVVGSSSQMRDSAESRAFIWTSETGMSDLGTLGGDYAQAYDINDAGWVTGTAEINDMGVRGRQTHAFIFQPLTRTMLYTGAMRDLGTLGGRFSYGMSINDSNHVAGSSTIDGDDNHYHAFLHDGEAMIDLGSLEKEGFGDYSKALAVNNSEQVVGVNYRTTGSRSRFNQVAFVWNRNEKGGQMVNLNNLIGGWSTTFWLLSATAINDHGQIAATAYDYRDGLVKGVILTKTK